MRKQLKIGVPVRLVQPPSMVYQLSEMWGTSFPRGTKGIVKQKSGDLYWIEWSQETTLKTWWPESYLEIDTIEYIKQLNKGKV